MFRFLVFILATGSIIGCNFTMEPDPGASTSANDEHSPGPFFDSGVREQAYDGGEFGGMGGELGGMGGAMALGGELGAGGLPESGIDASMALDPPPCHDAGLQDGEVLATADGGPGPDSGDAGVVGDGDVPCDGAMTCPDGGDGLSDACTPAADGTTRAQ